MDNAMLIGLTRQLTLRRAMDAAANNIANASTSGFKAERPLLETETAPRARHEDGPRRTLFVDEWAMGRDFRQGALQETGRRLDLALDGEGFFLLQTDQGERFTRDGRFLMNEAGELVAADGSRVLDEAGGPVQLDPQGGPIVIDASGLISQDGAPGARIAVARFENLSELEKVGDNRYAAPEDAERAFQDLARIRQGFIEGSNVSPIREITRMTEISRAYGSVTRMIRETDELSRQAIERLGRP